MVVRCRAMGKRTALYNGALFAVRFYSRIAPPPPAYAQPVIRVSNNIAYLGSPKEGPKPRQLLSLPPFPGLPLPGKNVLGDPGRLTAISWVKYYFNEMCGDNIESHFKKGLVYVECQTSSDSIEIKGLERSVRKFVCRLSLMMQWKWEQKFMFQYQLPSLGSQRGLTPFQVVLYTQMQMR
ncbi:hypothetical protein LINPERHAP2_LOCUS11317 [Linum perenne]